MSETKLKDRLRRLLALAQQGEPGEKDNAARLLERLLAKHGMTVEDLAERQPQAYTLSYRTSEERSLLIQVICRTLNKVTFDAAFRNSRVRSFTITCTPAEYFEITASFDLYARALRLEQERLLHAFIIRNQIFPSAEASAGAKTKDDELDIKEILRRVQLSRQLDVVPVHRQLVERTRAAIGGPGDCP